MAKESNIVHRYFKKKLEDCTVLVRVNPIALKGLEITIVPKGEAQIRELNFDDNIWDDLAADAFEESGALEFNLYYAGLAS